MKNCKWVTIVLLLILFVCLLGGCTQPPEQETTDASVPINPAPEAVNKDKTTARLYFGYASERLLVGENRSFDTPVNESIEKSIINELINGPSATRADFQPLIHPATTVTNVESQGQYLFVTLSSEFLQPVREDYDPNDDEQASNEKDRKFLAVYSIVNTLIEQGTYSRVTLMIDEEGVGRRLTQAEAGLEGDDPTDSFERNSVILLNGRNTMREILTAIEKKEWSTLYGYIANRDSYGQERPSLDDFTNEVVAAKLSISNYEVVDDVMLGDGLIDVIMVNYDLKLQDGEARPMTNIPIRLVQENDVWKMSYAVFKAKFLT